VPFKILRIFIKQEIEKVQRKNCNNNTIAKYIRKITTFKLVLNIYAIKFVPTKLSLRTGLLPLTLAFLNSTRISKCQQKANKNNTKEKYAIIENMSNSR
jgi:hypothetical protein